MKRLLGTIVALTWILVALTGCAGSPEASVIAGTRSAAGETPDEQFVWVGTGTSYVYNNGRWQRTPEQDYQFLVRQYRYSDRWESLKIQNRTSPEYDGVAGPADQQHFFLIEFGPVQEDGTIATALRSTYGDGAGWTDSGYRSAVLVFNAEGVSRFAPYNRFRISQEYRYDEGRLSETVELFKVESDGTETPYARIQEEARIFTGAQAPAR